jgi:hypothetical protein
MKKLLYMALPIVIATGIASAANPCNPLGFPQAITVSTISGTAGGFSCQLGDKIFSGFSTAGLNSTDSFTFTQTGAQSYTLSLNAGSEGVFGTNFNYGFNVAIDPTFVGIPAGSAAFFSNVSGAIIDTVSGSSSTLAKTITPNAGTGCPSGVFVTESVTTAGQSQTGSSCNLASTPRVTSVGVAEAYTYTGGANPSGVTQLQNTFTQALASTTGAPEPVSMLLFGTGLIGVALFGRKRLFSK